MFDYLILEANNEPRLGGDPFLQGSVVDNKIIAQEKVPSPPCPFRSAKMPPTVCPVPWAAEPAGRPALPGPGNHLTMLTAIFTDSVYAYELPQLSSALGFML